MGKTGSFRRVLKRVLLPGTNIAGGGKLATMEAMSI